LQTGRMKAVVMHREGRHHALRRPLSCVMKAVVMH